MDNYPTPIQHYISLRTQKNLPKDWVKKWYKCVKKMCPDGLMGSVQETDPTGEPTSVLMVKRELKDGQREYVIPLVRHLQDSESEPICDYWDSEYPYENYEIEVSQDAEELPTPNNDPDVWLTRDDYEELCWQLSKAQHNKWCRERTDDGWNYGPKFDRKAKKHPMLLPWDKLPSDWQDIDRETPKMFTEILDKQGYRIVPK